MKKPSSTVIPLLLISCSTFANNIFEYKSHRELIKPIDLSNTFAEQNIFNADSGSITFRIKPNINTADFTALLAATNPNDSNSFASFYLLRDKNAGTDTFGIELKNNKTNLIDNRNIRFTTDKSNDFRTITYTFDKANRKIKMYLDGQLMREHNDSKFFDQITALSDAHIGVAKRDRDYWRFRGEIYHASMTNEVLTEQKVQELHHTLATQHQMELTENIAKRESFGAFLTEKETLFRAGQKGAKKYRIPSILTTQKGTVIAAIDKRHQHSLDWGNIDTAIRRSLDGGKTWLEDQVVLDLVKQPYGSQNSAFLIDPSMVQDRNTGRIFMLLDMFPETKGFFGINTQSAEGTGYKNVKGNYYRLLVDSNNNQYTVRENGIVYDENSQPTDYRVVVEGTQERSFKDLGDLYKGEQRLGNVFLQTAQANNDSAPLKTIVTSYMWLTYSDDEGKTWSNPKDITPQVKADWMRFFGTGPGTGIQTKDGTLIMPIYYTNSNGKQSAAVILSRDGGETWERGESPNDRRYFSAGGSRYLNNSGGELTESQLVELDNGQIKLFSRNHSGHVAISTSSNGGYTWHNAVELDEVLLDPYSQMSVIKYSKRLNGKEYLVFANPHSSKRRNGKVWLGEVQDDGSIEWKYETTIEPNENGYAYNSLTELPNGDIGLFYEDRAGADHMQFVRLNLQELLWKDNILHRDARKDQEEGAFTYNRDGVDYETLYKIGDGEIIKVGVGNNTDRIIVEEGTLTLNQSADEQGNRQAFSHITINKNATIRSQGENQFSEENILLNQGTFDLYGNALTIDQPVKFDNLLKNGGSIINNNHNKSSKIDYVLSGHYSTTVNIGNENGAIDFSYHPQGFSSLTLNGNTHLNTLDVQSGNIIFANNSQHNIKIGELAIGSTLQLEGNSSVTVDKLNLNPISTVVIRNQPKETTVFSANTQGNGSIAKLGGGDLMLSGELKHTGATLLSGGNIILSGTIHNSNVAINNATLRGSGTILSDITLKNSIISPSGFTNIDNLTPANKRSKRSLDTTPSFSTLRFNNLHNDGSEIYLKVNNNDENIANWQHDRILISGDVQSTTSIPITLGLLGSQVGNSDKNSNGAYDNDEGISLIQVKGNAGETPLSLFTLKDKITHSNADVTKLTLVSVEKGAADPNNNGFAENSAEYWDYRLQSLLINENGEEVTPIIYKKATTESSNTENTESSHTMRETSAQTDEVATLSTTERDNPSVTDEKDSKKVILEDGSATDKNSTTENTSVEQPNIQQNGTITDKTAIDNTTTDNITTTHNVMTDEKAAINESAVISEKFVTSTQTTADNNATKVTEKVEEIAEAQSTDAKKITVANQVPTQNQLIANNTETATNETNKIARVALSDQVPSYLIASTALLEQGMYISNIFKQNAQYNQQHFYVLQNHSNAHYSSNLNFSQYGYHYEVKQNTTLFAGNLPLNDHSALHAGLAFSRYNITPKAVDGHSIGKYKTVGLLLKHHSQIAQFSVDLYTAYYHHKGTITTTEKNVATVTAHQLNLGSEVRYDLNWHNMTLSPLVGLGYSQLTSSLTDHSTYDWKIDSPNRYVFSTQVGSQLSYQLAPASINLRAVYANNYGNQGITNIKTNTTHSFQNGKIGNLFMFSSDIKFNLSKNLSLSAQLQYQKPADKVGVERKDISAKLEYRF